MVVTNYLHVRPIIAKMSLQCNCDINSLRNMHKVIISLTNHQSDYELGFDLLDTSITHKWLKHLALFIDAGQPWDDAKRFYNFPNSEYTHDRVVKHLKSLIEIINNYAPGLINLDVGPMLSQDNLNYLHHIFELYHGLYDQQSNNQFFSGAPIEVQNALGDLNIWIHRYESLNDFPRFVATWKYKPYRDIIEHNEFDLFSLHEQWGDLRLNYCEIGKTLYDLWHDNDQYIASEAFKPQHHMCFDFTVRFNPSSDQQFSNTEQLIWQYFDNNQDFFHAQGYKKYDSSLSLGSITLGRLVQTEPRDKIIDMISKHQCMKSIKVVTT